MTTTTYNIDTYLDTARQFAAEVARQADYIDEARELPPELAGEMEDRGFFRLLVPRSLGGSELALPDFLRVVEVFAGVDASTAWCVNQNNVWATNSTRMSLRTAREIWGKPRSIVTNGPPHPGTKAVPTDGGYVLSGRWSFSSGSDHATWLAALAPVLKGDDGSSADDRQELVFLMPKKDFGIVDEWHVNGLRGTASLGFETDGMFVPGARAFDMDGPPRDDGPLYVIPNGLLFPSGFSTVALGVSRAALDAAIEIAGGKVPARERGKLRDFGTVQRQVGQAMATWRSAKAFLREAVGAAWEGACENGALSMEERITLRVAATHGIRMAAQVVDAAYDICGSGAIFKSHPVQRRFQDVHVITQQIQGRMTHYDTAGQYFLGLEPRGAF